MDNKLERIRNEAVVAQFKLLSRHLPGRSEKSPEVFSLSNLSSDRHWNPGPLQQKVDLRPRRFLLSFFIHNSDASRDPFSTSVRNTRLNGTRIGVLAVLRIAPCCLSAVSRYQRTTQHHSKGHRCAFWPSKQTCLQ